MLSANKSRVGPSLPVTVGRRPVMAPKRRTVSTKLRTTTTSTATVSQPLLTRTRSLVIVGVALTSCCFAFLGQTTIRNAYDCISFFTPSAPSPLDSPSPFHVVVLPGKGKGVIATRDIPRGQLFIRESPLFVVPTEISTSPQVLVLKQLSALNTTQQKSFYDLSYVESNLPNGKSKTPDQADVAVAILQTNGVAAGDSVVGIFPQMARLNHGCSSAFNVVYSWRENSGEIVVHAIRDIHQGEEKFPRLHTTM